MTTPSYNRSGAPRALLRGWGLTLLCLCVGFAQLACDDADSQKRAGRGQDAGADGAAPEGGSAGMAGSAGAAGTGGMPTGGTGGVPSTGGVGGTGGTTGGTGGMPPDPPDPGAPGTRAVSGGAYMKSPRFKLMISAGQSPGSSKPASGGKYSMHGGLVGSVH
ncbi:MAG: hypothetical protein H6718_23220 [Polyangiaceae bacterium]|nr:hypothetical protein [Polyangiaceae bacterium]